MKAKLVIGLCVVLLVFGAGCDLFSLVTGGKSAVTVSELWSDVPPLSGATKESIDIPAPIKIAISAMLGGQMEFIVYTTPQTPQEVRDFYTVESMQAAGWSPDSPGCAGAKGTPSTSGAENMCIFEKKEGGKDVGLVIIIAQDDKTKKTTLFYVRVVGQPTPEKGTPATK
jgi:hypothetical protein